MQIYKHYEDGGHSWLEVAKAELKEMGILDKITAFSYEKGTYLYLEEDCDLGTFLQAKFNYTEYNPEVAPKIKNFFEQQTHRIYHDQSPVRNYKHYTGGKE